VRSYLVVVEQTPGGFTGYTPDLPGCVSTAASRDELERKMREAIEFHLEILRDVGQPMPTPRSVAAWVDVA
jgi:predicted RNase H-like HicB family nuclease